MEVVLCGALATVWWISSLSVLLPFVLLLKYSKRFRDRWFSFLFVRICGPLCDHKSWPMRKRTFEVLNEHLVQRKKNVPLEILEIGIGSGANLQYYPENANLTALDMNENFEVYFHENQKKHPQVTYKKTVIGMAENMDDVEGASMDIVICTYVLCSVNEIDQVLSQVKRVLKPGGKFLFLEHVIYPSSNWGSTLQRFTAPLWRIYFDGCCLDRDIANHIKRAGFREVCLENQLPPSLLMFYRPQIIGVATK